MASSTPNLPALRLADDELILRDCRWEAFRASGPGGQKRNKTSSAIRLTHLPTGLSAIASESRSQAANRQSALRRLRRSIALELRHPIALDSLELPGWFAASTEARNLSIGRRAALYLPVVGFTLDLLEACTWSVSQAARHLHVSTATLVQFLQRDEKVMAYVNRMRQRCGLKRLGVD